MAMKVHKAVEPTNLTAKGREALADLLKHNQEHALLLPKLDGVYVQFKYGGSEAGWTAWSRTGERMLSMETAARLHHFKENAKEHLVYIGEAWSMGVPHAEINGMARRKYPQPELDLYLHDTYSEHMMDSLGVDTIPFIDRLRRAGYMRDQASATFTVANYPLSDNTGYTIEEMLEYAKWFQTEGLSHGNVYDGLILRDAMAPFVPGAGKDGGIYKLKPRKSLDLLVVDEHEELRTTKAGGYLTVEHNGVRTDVGSGLTQGMLILIHEAKVDNRKYFVGQIAEVEFLDFTKDGKLREPVLKAIRWDKDKPDA